ncbi:TIGR01440 family protein [Salinicoccus sp. HZC-1]|uniref:TIGR01440 family protein n=1 Tax=Salinicoccus sp. HZC-1 TaxID=3385497 RepID=UPI00398AF969
MNEEFARLKNDIDTLIENLTDADFFAQGEDLVIGCSTSEVLGHHIGKQSSIDVAELIFEAFDEISKKFDINLMFQGCEHINRAVTMEHKIAKKYGYEVVNVVPHRGAGGSLSEYAYKHLEQPVVVEHIKANRGIDIGQTLIGMHLRHVVVPLRTEQKTVGRANVTVAFSRPKLIGGPRAHY